MVDQEEQVRTELKREQRLKNLMKLLDENNYDNIKPQENSSFVYLGATKRVKIEWATVRVEDLHPRRIENNKPGPRRAVKLVDTPLEAFNLFLTESMISNIFAYTNASIHLVLDQFDETLCNFYKYPHFRSVDRIHIETFLGMLYLRAAFRQDLIKVSSIWNQEVSMIFPTALPCH